jgi:hypothetical protein
MLISSFAQLGGGLVAPAPVHARGTEHSPFARDMAVALGVGAVAISHNN